MSPRRFLTAGFWAGFALHAIWVGIQQDLMGQEGVIRHVRDHWVDSRITLPIELALAVVVLAGYAFVAFRAEDSQ